MVYNIIMKKIFVFIILISNLLLSEELKIYCRNSLTGEFLDCNLYFSNQKINLKKGKNLFDFKEGNYNFLVEAEGYKGLSSNFSFPSNLKSITFYLDELKERPFEEEIRGKAKIKGFIYDREKGIPLEDVIVIGEGFEVFSKKDGFFEVEIPSKSFDFGEEIPTIKICFFKKNYKDLCLEKILNLEGITNYIIDMEEGVGELKFENEHHFFYNEEKEYFEEEEISNNYPLEFIKLSDKIPPQLLLQIIDPPDTIRVGMNCSCTVCSSVDVLSLETYVKRGLNDEWISSWNTHSLRAGSIAYRSYGTYYVYHPINSNYDICSSTCCQVNDTDTATSTDIATDKTAGILLQRSGSVFRSEYSAENNSWDDPNDGKTCSNSDLSCGDGYAGSPSASWPCLSDNPCIGYGCYGHGRGMCQWGTQRWAYYQGQLWKWIVNHYYNDNGSGSGLRTAYMTSPFSINSVSAVPSTISSGGSFTINLNVTSYAEISHSQIMIGASLYSSSTGYISDPSNDNKITLNPGSNTPSRQFTTPSNIPEGTYDLIVAIWLDVDENNQVTSSDLSLTSFTLSSAIIVSNIIYGNCSNPYIVSSFPYSHSSNNSSTSANLSNYNCNSLRDSTGREVVYKLTIVAEGILSASISPSSPLDLYLTKSCTNYTCISFGDSTISKYLQAGEYYLIIDGPSSSTYDLNINFTQKDLSPPADNTSLRLSKQNNQILLNWILPSQNIYGGSENVAKTNIFRGTNPQNLIYYTQAQGNSILLSDLSSSENYFYRLSFEDSSGNRSLPCQIETIMDNVEATYEGNWNLSTSQPDRWGENYSFSWGSGNDSNKAHFLPFLNCITYNYEVYTFYPATTNRCNTTKYTINNSSGSSVIYIDQTSNGGIWYSLGSYNFNKNISYETIVSDGNCASNKAVIADALKFLPVPKNEYILDDDEAVFIGTWSYSISSEGYNGDYYWRSTGGNGSNYAEWIPFLYEAGNYDVYVWYRSGANRSQQTPYTITTSTGDVTIYVNQQQNGSQWFYIGNFELNPSTAKIKVSDNAPSGAVVVADAVRFVKSISF